MKHRLLHHLAKLSAQFIVFRSVKAEIKTLSHTEDMPEAGSGLRKFSIAFNF